MKETPPPTPPQKKKKKVLDLNIIYVYKKPLSG